MKRLLIAFCLIVSSSAGSANTVQTCIPVNQEMHHTICVSTPLPDFQAIVPNLNDQAFRDLNMLLDTRELLRLAVPNLGLEQALDAVKSFEDLRNLQATLVPQLPTITDTFYQELMRANDTSLTALRAMDKLTIPTARTSALMIASPKFINGSEVIAKVNAFQVEKGLRPLDLDGHGGHIKAMSSVFYVLLRDERAIFESYLAEHQQINKQLTDQNLASVSGTLSALATAPMENQQVELGGEHPGHLPTTESYSPPPRRPDLQPVYMNLMRIDSSAPQSGFAKDLGLRALSAADEAYGSGDHETGDLLKTVAVTMADVGLGFIPVVGVSRDLYELFIGRNLLTDEELSVAERGLALAGVMSVGVISSAGKAAKAMVKLGTHADDAKRMAGQAERVIEVIDEIGAKAPESIQTLQKASRQGFTDDSLSILTDISDGIFRRTKAMGMRLRDVRIGFADDLNAEMLARFPGSEISYRPATRLIEGALDTEVEGFVRVFGPGSDMAGRWLVDKRILYKDGKLMSPSDIKDLLNLPELPTHIVDFKVPAGTDIRVSQVAKNKYGKYEGAIQIEILDSARALRKMVNKKSMRALK